MPTVSEISSRLSADNSQYRSVMADSEQIAGRTGQGILRKLDLRGATTAIATAIGFNIQSIAETLARNITGVSKEVEDQYKKLVELSEKAADAGIKNSRARLNDEDKYRMALQDREQLEKRINANNGVSLQDQNRQKEDQLKLEQKISDIREIEEKREKDRAAQQKARYDAESAARSGLAEAQREAGMSELQAYQKVRIVKQEISDLEKIIASGVLSENNASELSVVLAQRKVELLKLEKDASEAVGKAVNDAIDARVETNRILEEQSKLTAKLAKDEEKRLRIAEGVAEAAKKTNEAHAMGIGGLTQSRFGSREIQDASDSTLKEIIRRNKGELQLRELNPGGPGDIDKIYPILQLKNEIAKISEELGLRTTIRNNVSRMGVEGARRAFDGNPLVFDKLVEQFTNQQTKIDKTNQLLERMNEKLAGGIRVRSITTPGSEVFAA